MNIAVIDDDPLFQFITKKMIGRLLPNHPNVSSFLNGQEAIDYFKNDNTTLPILPDLILLDINMPVVNGWQFLDWYHQADWLNTKIYLVSSSIAESDRVKAEEYEQLSGFLIKPLSEKQLMELIIMSK